MFPPILKVRRFNLAALAFQWFPPRADGKRRIVFFDGVCALCDRSVTMLLEADRGRVLLFAPLQGEEAAKRFGPLTGKPGSMLYATDERTLERSDAVLAILDDLGGWWRPLAWLGRLVPAPLRNWLYDRIASSRYRVFGRYDSCRMPREGERERMLD